jgi:hypothetical protein
MELTTSRGTTQFYSRGLISPWSGVQLSPLALPYSFGKANAVVSVSCAARFEHVP